MSIPRSGILRGVVGLAALVTVLLCAHEVRAEPPKLKYTMADGSVVVGTPVSENSTEVTVVTRMGTLKLQKSQIVSVAMADDSAGGDASPPPTGDGTPPPDNGGVYDPESGQPAEGALPVPVPSSGAPSPLTAEPRLPDDDTGDEPTGAADLFMSSTGAFVLMYGLVAVPAAIVVETSDGDPDRKRNAKRWGLMPVAGPLGWALTGKRDADEITFGAIASVIEGVSFATMIGSAIGIAAGNRGGGQALVRIGLATFASTWGTTALIGVGLKEPYALIPVAGPVLWARDDPEDKGIGFAVVASVLQGTAVMTILMGMIAGEYEEPPPVSVVPLYQPDGVGVGVTWRY